MAGVHVLIGLGEALITFGALSFVYAARRDLLGLGSPARSAGARGVVAAGLLLTLALAALSPLASSHPDGLEWVAEQAGFLDTAQGPTYEIIPDYVFPGISNEATATIVAGVVGALIVLGVTLLAGYARRRRDDDMAGQSRSGATGD
jgi:cobalt/nickel transport system permease protein